MSQLGDDVVVRSVENLLEGRPGPNTKCLNCNAVLSGLYCSDCGQKASGIDVSLREFAAEALDSLFSFDSRVWLTLRHLVRRPGFLTVEYWRGHRARYVAPLRLYLFVSFFAFLVFGVVTNPQIVQAGATWDDGSGEKQAVQATSDMAQEIDWDEDLRDAPVLIRAFVLGVVRPIVENPEQTQLLFMQRMPWAVFVMVPFFAALLRLFFRSPKRYFVAHLVFSLHLHAVVFLLLALGDLGDWATSSEVFSALSAVAIVVVLFLSLRRAYGDHWFKTLLKSLVLLFVHLIAVGVAMLVMISITALTL